MPSEKPAVAELPLPQDYTSSGWFKCDCGLRFHFTYDTRDCKQYVPGWLENHCTCPHCGKIQFKD